VAIKPDQTWTFKCQCRPSFIGERCQSK
jgi:hypothetical protein